MIFLFSPFAGAPVISLDKKEENFGYLSKVKRHTVGDKIFLGNLKDNMLYEYIFSEISGKNIMLDRTPNSEKISEKIQKKLHLVWGMCDQKTVYKTLPALNEFGVSKITFVECERTQRNFSQTLQSEKSIQKIQKILENSCQQCGRTQRMEIEFDTFKQFFLEHFEAEYAVICDFSDTKPFPEISQKKGDIQTVVIGPEGGFTDNEKQFFLENFPEKIYQFSGNTVLRSETAAVGIAGKILL